MSNANHYQLAVLLTAAVNFILLCFIIKRASYKRRLVFLFSIYCGAIVFWSGFVFFATIATNHALAIVFTQLCHVGATLIPLLFFEFSCLFLGIKLSRVIRMTALGAAIFFLVLILLFPMRFFSSVVPKLGFAHFPDASWLYSFWMIYFSVLVVATHLVLFKAFANSQGMKRRQLRFFFLEAVS